MRTKLLLSVLSILFIGSTPASEDLCHNASALCRTLYRFHIQAPAYSAELEKQIVLDAITELDPNALYFLSSDIDELTALSFGLLDTLDNSACELSDALSQTFFKRWSYSNEKIKTLLETPATANDRGSIILRKPRPEDFVADQDALDQRIETFVALSIFSEYYDQQVEYDSVNGEEITRFEDFEAAIRGRRLQRMACKDIPEGEARVIANRSVLEAIAHSFDPHSSYFSPLQKTRFQRMLSNYELSFGLVFTSGEEDEIRVGDIIPGGPAWKSGSIYEGDLLERITTTSGSELPFTCEDGFEITELINAGSDRQLVFHLRHADGSRENVQLRKNFVEVDDNVIRGLKLEGERSIGYVALPSFYTDWNDAEGLGCANDVAKEILQLKREGIEGLILDLRFNGGGSLDEALQLAGLFVNEGALLITTEKGVKPKLAKDPNRGTVYNDPVIVLVNSYSASASEVVAAALQDHNRALIVGSSTYGKSTSQIIIPLLNASGRNFTNGQTGSVKVTQGVLHRISGQTHQAIGVQPDIYLPDAYLGLADLEAAAENALRFENINKKTYTTPLAPLPVTELKETSTARLDSTKRFEHVISENKQIHALFDTEEFSVNPEAVKRFNQDFQRTMDALNAALYNESSNYTVTQYTQSQTLSDLDDLEQLNVERLKSQVQEDVYLQEVFNIMVDWLKFAE